MDLHLSQSISDTSSNSSFYDLHSRRMAQFYSMSSHVACHIEFTNLITSYETHYYMNDSLPSCSRSLSPILRFISQASITSLRSYIRSCASREFANPISILSLIEEYFIFRNSVPFFKKTSL